MLASGVLVDRVMLVPVDALVVGKVTADPCVMVDMANEVPNARVGMAKWVREAVSEDREQHYFLDEAGDYIAQMVQNGVEDKVVGILVNHSWVDTEPSSVVVDRVVVSVVMEMLEASAYSNVEGDEYLVKISTVLVVVVEDEGAYP